MNFIEFLSDQKASPVIEASLSFEHYISLDLSVHNLALQNLETSADYEIFIENYLQQNKAQIAYGGYLEKRNLYKRSTVFNTDPSTERNIHIGVDFWINKQATIHAAFEGTIHSFQNNNHLGDYGPTIILEHQIEQITFYTLYGHLSEESLTNKLVGQTVQKGEIIAYLGLPPINGDYAPHLHFQIIKDLQGKTGDYPGVCNEKDLGFYKENCPDPMVIFN